MLVCYGAALVYSSLVLLFLCGTMSTDSTRTVEPLASQSLSNFVLQLKSDIIIVFIVALLMLQYSLFSIVTSNHCDPPTSRDQKETISTFVFSSMNTHISSFCCPRGVISMLLLLCGDVEQNPGPTHQRSYSYPLSCRESEHKESAEIKKLKEEFRFLLQQGRDDLKRCLGDKKKLELEPSTAAKKLMDEFDRCCSHIKRLEAEVAEYLSKIKKLKTDLSKTKTRLNAAQATLKAMSKRSEEYKDLIACLEKQVDILTSRNAHENTHPTLTFDARGDEILLAITSDFNELVKECIDPQTCLPYQNKRVKYLKEVSLFLDGYSMWKSKLQDTENVRLGDKLFHVLANQRYLLSKSPQVQICPFCFRSDKIRDSHIWPESFLHSFTTIHHVTEGKSIPYVNISDIEPSKINPGKITVKMLCSKCEGLGEEEKLLRHYCFFNAKPFCTLEFDNKDSWFHRTLAVIMARGILMNCNLLKELHVQPGDSEVLRALLNLRDFCRDRSNKLPQKLSVFLLPHDFYSGNPNIFSMFERQLRNPEFTSVFDLYSEGLDESRFLCMQFCCIHVTYPLCEGSADYFKQHSHTEYPCGVDDEKLRFPSSDVRKDLFPSALLSINFSRALSRARYWINQPSSDYFDCSIAFVKHCEQVSHIQTIRKYTVPEPLNHDVCVLDYDSEVSKEVAQKKKGKHQVYTEACVSEAKRLSILKRLSIFQKITPTDRKHFLDTLCQMQKLLSKGPPHMEFLSEVKRTATTLGETSEGIRLQKAIAKFEKKVELWKTDMLQEQKNLDKLIAQSENKPSPPSPGTKYPSPQEQPHYSEHTLPVSTETHYVTPSNLKPGTQTELLATAEVVPVAGQTQQDERPLLATAEVVPIEAGQTQQDERPLLATAEVVPIEAGQTQQDERPLLATAVVVSVEAGQTQQDERPLVATADMVAVEAGQTQQDERPLVATAVVVAVEAGQTPKQPQKYPVQNEMVL